MNSFLNSDFCARLTCTMLHFVWQGALLAVLALASGFALRRARPVLRYWTYVVALVAMVAAPAFTFLRLAPIRPPSDTVHVELPAQVDVTRASGADSAPLPVKTTVAARADDIVAVQSQAAASAQPMAAKIVAAPVVPSLKQRLLDFFAPSNYRRIAPWVTACYVTGVFLMLARLLLALRGGRGLRRKSQSVTESMLIATLQRAAASLRLRAIPAVAWCREVATPTVVGILKPTILLPLSLASGLSSQQVEMLLLHELAHLRRHDHWINLAQWIIETLLFFHPGVWWLSARIRTERELACDDMVLSAGIERADYAESLLTMAELSRQVMQSEADALALCSHGRRFSGFGRRVLRLLDGRGHTESIRPGRVWPLGAVAAMLLAACFSVALRGAAKDSEPSDHNYPSVTFPNGVRGEIVGVGLAGPDEANHCWAADGTPLPGIPEGFEANKNPGSEQGKTPIDIFIRFRNSVSKSGVSFACRPGSASNGTQKGADDLLRKTMFLEPGTKSVNPELGLVQAKDYQDIQSTDGTGSSGYGFSLDGKSTNVSFSKAFREGDKVSIVVAMNEDQLSNNGAYQVRLIALDAAGREYTPNAMSGNAHQNTYTFESIPPKTKLTTFKLQRAPYEWREIKGVAAEPAARPSASKAPWQSPSQRVFARIPATAPLAGDLLKEVYTIDTDTGTARFVAGLLGRELRLARGMSDDKVLVEPSGMTPELRDLDPTTQSRHIVRLYPTIVDLTTGEKTPLPELKDYYAISWADISPDGRKLALDAYVLRQSVSIEHGVFAYDFASKQIRKVLSQGCLPCRSRCWSPDSRMLAISPVGSADGWISSDDPGPEIVLADVETGDVKRTGLHGIEAVFSPDGKRLVCSEGALQPTGNIVQLDLSSNTTTPLTQLPDGGALAPRFSPDGTRLAWWERRRTEEVLHMLDMDSGKDIAVTTGSSIGRMRWLDSNSRLAVSSVADLRRDPVVVQLVDFAGDKPTVRFLTVSPPPCPGQLTSAAADALKRLSDVSDACSKASKAQQQSADSALALHKRAYEALKGYDDDLSSGKASSALISRAELVPYLELLRQAAGIQTTPATTQNIRTGSQKTPPEVLVTAPLRDYLLQQLWAINPETGAARLVTDTLGCELKVNCRLGSDQALVAPHSVLFAHFGNEPIGHAGRPLANTSLMAVDLKTGEKKAMPSFKDCDILYSDLSPDGRKLAFVGSRKSAETTESAGGIFVCDLDSGDLKSVLQGWMKTCPHWSPDSRWLVVSKGEGYSNNQPLVLIDTVSGEVKDTGLQGAGAVFSPDGKSIVYSGDFKSGGSWSAGVPSFGNLIEADLSENTTKPLTSFPEGGAIFPQFSPDGTRLGWWEDRSKEKQQILHVLDMASGKDREITTGSAFGQLRWLDSNSRIMINPGESTRPERPLDKPVLYVQLIDLSGDTPSVRAMAVRTPDNTAAQRAAAKAVSDRLMEVFTIYRDAVRAKDEHRLDQAVALYKKAYDRLKAFADELAASSTAGSSQLLSRVDLDPYLEAFAKDAAPTKAELGTQIVTDNLKYYVATILGLYVSENGRLPSDAKELVRWALQADFQISHIKSSDSELIVALFQVPGLERKDAETTVPKQTPIPGIAGAIVKNVWGSPRVPPATDYRLVRSDEKKGIWVLEIPAASGGKALEATYRVDRSERRPDVKVDIKEK